MYKLLLILLSGCFFSNTISYTALSEKAHEYDSTWTDIIPENMAHPRSCQDYGPNCIRAREVMVNNVIFVLVHFKDHDSACNNAVAINEYCYKNWLFSEVTGEPVVEKFVKEAFGAISSSP